MVYRLVAIFFILLALSGCGQSPLKGKIEKVGLLVPDTINDQVWGTKGYNNPSTMSTSIIKRESIMTLPLKWL